MQALVLTPGLTAADVPDWDSFIHINLIVAVETRFKIKFQTAELEQLHKEQGNLADIVRDLTKPTKDDGAD